MNQIMRLSTEGETNDEVINKSISDSWIYNYVVKSLRASYIVATDSLVQKEQPLCGLGCLNRSHVITRALVYPC